jgi:competence protein ComEA
MKQIIRDYLTFNKRERNGVFVLISIIILMLVYLNISEKFYRVKNIDFTEFRREADSMNSFLKRSQSQLLENESSSEIKESSAQIKSERFHFNPNNLPELGWKRLGLTEKQIKTIKNYEAKGGRFKKKEDLKKMYCIKPEQYASLEPFIQIPDASSVFENGKVVSDKSLTRNENHQNNNVMPVGRKNDGGVVELNAADSAILTTIKGIGAFYAKTIIKYRNSLGGFHSKEQLLEVWKFDSEKYAAIEKFVSVDPSKIKKININTCEAEQLKIPYLKWNMANAIVNYRKHHGSFKTIDDIKQTDLVDEETLRKIAPYLSLE